jgi:hypothetical protein
MAVAMNTIAAEFEDCMETCQSLCSAMEANEAAWPGKLAAMCECRKALLQWGYGTGAATRALDYALHKNSDLRDEVLELLEGFKATLQSSTSAFISLNENPCCGGAKNIYLQRWSLSRSPLCLY